MYTVQVKVRLPSTAVVGSYLLVRGIKKNNNKKWRGKTDIRIQGVIVPEIYIQLWPINIVVGQIAPPFPIRNSLIRKIFVFLQKPDFLAKPVFWSDQKTTLVWPENRKIEIFHMRSSFSCRKPIFFFWPFFAGDFTVPAAWFTYRNSRNFLAQPSIWRSKAWARKTTMHSEARTCTAGPKTMSNFTGTVGRFCYQFSVIFQNKISCVNLLHSCSCR